MMTWTRRQFVQGAGVVGLGLVAGCGGLLQGSRPGGDARSSATIHRIGLLSSGAASPSSLTDAFRQGLAELGYREGENLVLESRFAEGHNDRLPDLAAELVQRDVRLIFAASSTAGQAARSATQTIPLVAVGMTSDPVATGLIQSLARPGGNLTGLFVGLPELGGKLLELLKDTVPAVRGVAVLRSGGDPGHAALFHEVESAGRALGVLVQPVDARESDDLERPLAAASDQGADGLVVFSGTLFNTHRVRIAQLALQYRLPAIAAVSEFAADGGLLAYGPSFHHMYHRAATYVDKILKGAMPADLPVERPTRFEFVINLKTAQALGLTIPQPVLLQATEVIQ